MLEIWILSCESNQKCIIIIENPWQNVILLSNTYSPIIPIIWEHAEVAIIEKWWMLTCVQVTIATVLLKEDCKIIDSKLGSYVENSYHSRPTSAFHLFLFSHNELKAYVVFIFDIHFLFCLEKFTDSEFVASFLN